MLGRTLGACARHSEGLRTPSRPLNPAGFRFGEPIRLQRPPAYITGMSRVLSFVEEQERIFGRWLSEVEQLVGHGLDRDAAFDAWANGYSATEYAGFIELGIH